MPDTSLTMADVVERTAYKTIDLLFTLGHRPNSSSYYTLYTLADGSTKIMRCNYQLDTPERIDLSDYAQDLFATLDSSNPSQKVLGFGLLACSQEGDWFCHVTNAHLHALALEFIPFYNEDGSADFLPNQLDPESSRAMLTPLLKAASVVWSIAFESGAANLELDEITQDELRVEDEVLN